MYKGCGAASEPQKRARLGCLRARHHPQPVVGCAPPRPVSPEGLRPLHPRGRTSSDLARREEMGQEGRREGRHRRHGCYRRTGWACGFADLPRHHQSERVPGPPGGGALHLARRARHLGRDRRWLARRVVRPAQEGHRVRRGRRHGRAVPAGGPGDRAPRQLLQPGALRQGDDLPWALEIDGAHSPDGLPGTYHPTFLYELLWNLGVAASCCGPTTSGSSARVARSPSTSLPTASAAAGSRRCAIDTANHFFGHPAQRLRVRASASSVL